MQFETILLHAPSLAMTANSAVQSSTQTFFLNDILFMDTPNNAYYKPPHSLIRTPYLAIIASNDIFMQL